jgi:hypothetical protein
MVFGTGKQAIGWEEFRQGMTGKRMRWQGAARARTLNRGDEKKKHRKEKQSSLR